GEDDVAAAGGGGVPRKQPGLVDPAGLGPDVALGGGAGEAADQRAGAGGQRKRADEALRPGAGQRRLQQRPPLPGGTVVVAGEPRAVGRHPGQRNAELALHGGGDGGQPGGGRARGAAARAVADLLDQELGDEVVALVEHLADEVADRRGGQGGEDGAAGGGGGGGVRAVDPDAGPEQRGPEVGQVAGDGIGGVVGVGAELVAVDDESRERADEHRHVFRQPARSGADVVVAALVADQTSPDLVDAPGLHGGGEIVEGVRPPGLERGVAAAHEDDIAVEGAAVLRAGGADLGDQGVGLGEQRQHAHRRQELLVGGRGQREVAVAA